MTRPAWQVFRTRIIDALWDPERFVYMDRDKVLGVCPSCQSTPPHYLAAAFVGETTTVDLKCSAGCTPLQLALAFDLPITEQRLSREERLMILRKRRERQFADAGIGDYQDAGQL